MPGFYAFTSGPSDSFLSPNCTPDPLRDLGTWQPSWPSLRSPTGTVATHSALYVSPQTTQDLEKKQWGQCHRYTVMSLNLASHSKARGQTQSDARKGFISLKKGKKKNKQKKQLNKHKKSKARKKLYYLSPQKPLFPSFAPGLKITCLFPLLDLMKSVLSTSFHMFYFSYF